MATNRPIMPMITRLYWSNSASVMYMGIPSFPEGKKKLFTSLLKSGRD